jgi:hypothetical protein
MLGQNPENKPEQNIFFYFLKKVWPITMPAS